MSKKILVVVHEAAEDLELWYPIYRVKEAGYAVDLASEKANMTFRGKYGVPYTANISWDDVSADDYAGLLIPGGWAPDKIRRFDAVKKLVKAFNDAKKPIGQICHAGHVTISAGIVAGRRVTSTPGIKDDFINAGSIWVDEAVVIDGNIVSSRKPDDLPEYAKAFVDLLEKQ